MSERRRQRAAQTSTPPPPDDEIPPALLTFDLASWDPGAPGPGHPDHYTPGYIESPSGWRRNAAVTRWVRAREAWAAEHGTAHHLMPGAGTGRRRLIVRGPAVDAPLPSTDPTQPVGDPEHG